MTRRVFVPVVILLALCMGLGCTYFWRKEYKLSDGLGYAVVSGWTITPKVISPAICSDLKMQVSAPDAFAISFRAARPRPQSEGSASPEMITDLMIDSALVLFRQKGTRLDLRFNEAIWVSYDAVSPDTLVKTFRIVDKLGDPVWMTLPSDSDTLEITLYTTIHDGELSAVRRAEDMRWPLDTAYWRPSDAPPAHPTPLTIRMDCRDIQWVLPGFRNCD